MNRNLNIMLLCVLCAVAVSGTSCQKHNDVTKSYFVINQVQENTAVVLWDPDVYNFGDANKHLLDYCDKQEEDGSEASFSGACSAWRNSHFHGRNLDWYQRDFGCLIVQMPKGKNVPHASVGIVSANPRVTHDFIRNGVIDQKQRVVMPGTTVDGINDAGVVINVNIVPHQTGEKFIHKEGNLASGIVPRLVLDNAGSVDEAIALLSKYKVRQTLVKTAGDEHHFMISDPTKTAVVEWPNGVMTVTYYNGSPNGYFSPKGKSAIMTNLYNFVLEQQTIGSDEFYEVHPNAMGVERWLTVFNQYSDAARDVDANLEIARSVWYFKGLMADKAMWYTENAVPGSGYGKDPGKGWYYMVGKNITYVKDVTEAMTGYWNNNMADYWKTYDEKFGILPDPHVPENSYWETSHSVVYDITGKKGYVLPFENYYSPDGRAIVMTLP